MHPMQESRVWTRMMWCRYVTPREPWLICRLSRSMESLFPSPRATVREGERKREREGGRERERERERECVCVSLPTK